MKNKKFITLLLAAIVAITSAAPGIQVKAEELFSFNVVLDGSGNYTVATGSSVATATPVPTETVEQTASPFVTAAPKRTGKIWYRYNNVRYCYDKELEKFVLECEKCEKTITAWPQNRYKIHKHIKNCKGKKISRSTSTSRSTSARLANYGEDVIASNMVLGTEPSYKKYKKFSKKYGLWSGEVTFKGREELTVSIEGYGTYVLNVSEYSPGGIGLNCTTYLYLKWK
jgi:hypothetical protein